jgi:hypothetical protein
MKKPAEAGEGPWSPEEKLHCVPITAEDARNFVTSRMKAGLNGATRNENTRCRYFDLRH